jgi:peptidoglycan/LPS O-acetylase OafA/YrhL
MATPGRKHHDPALDGIRGLAILGVLIQHCYFRAPGATSLIDRSLIQVREIGWVGIELFFALSGFLITGILLDSKGSDGYFRNFFGRRVLRIFPLYYATLLVLFYLVPRLGIVPGPESAQVVDVQGWYWSYLQNFFIALRMKANPDQLLFYTGHLWSLAVEEQFYVVWPLLIYSLRRKHVAYACAGLIVLAAALRVAALWHGVGPRAIYTLTPFRMDSLAAGSLLALAVRYPAASGFLTRWARPAFMAGIAGTIGSMVLARDASPFHWPVQSFGYTSIAVWSAALIFLARAAPPSALIARFIRQRPLLLLGQYSYGIYIIHAFVLFAAVRLLGPLPLMYGYGWPSSLLLMVCLMTISIAASALSWHWYEAPFLRLKSHFSPRRPVAGAILQARTTSLGSPTQEAPAPGEERPVTT